MFVSSTATHVLVYTPAKLNLVLEVLARRADGFHEIETLMGAVTIFDTLEFAPRSDGKLTLECRWAGGMVAGALKSPAPGGLRHSGGGPDGSSREDRVATAVGDLPPPGDNIVHWAVARLRERSASRCGADIRLIKRIPSAAGLGGASSDAAAALVAANLAWKLGWPRQRLMDLAAELGSDVPFFLGHGFAVCRGRGERLDATAGARVHFVVVRPPVGLATADVYRRCRPAATPADVEPLKASLAAGDWRKVRGQLVNRLEGPAAELTPWIGKVKTALGRLGCTVSQMSGSGSSCFGICRSARHARRLAAQLRSMELGLVYQATSAAGAERPAAWNGRGDVGSAS